MTREFAARPRWFLSPRRRRVAGLSAAILAVAIIVGGVVIYNRLFRAAPPPYFESAEDHFLYGSIGAEANGIPYWIWLTLPRIFPEHLPRPGGYAALGLLSRDGREMPVGLSKVTIGVPRVGVNCAFCHAASFRARADDVPTVYPAAAAHQTGAQEYARFLIACADDARFSADTILDEIAKNTRLSIFDRLLYRFVLIPATRRGILQRSDEDAWTRSRPDWGRGRVDAIDTAKFGVLGQPADDSIATADMMPLWSLQRRDRSSFGWDGSNSSLREMVEAAAVVSGTTTTWLDRDHRGWDSSDPKAVSSLRRVANYIGAVAAPRYPLPIDAGLAAAGAATYESACASCHKAGGARTGTVIPLAEIGTDQHRLDAWTSAAASAANSLGDGHDWQFSKFRKTAGYVATPLTGVWLNAPYLHNGSVPTLADLLEAPANRPATFWRGYDLYDSARLGFVTQGPEAERDGSRMDVSLPGNSNVGHAYGTELAPDAKRALLEYLKTL